MKVDTSKVKLRIKELDAEIAACDCTLEESIKASKICSAMMENLENLTDSEITIFKDANQKMLRHHFTQERDQLAHTLTLNLMKVETKYLITNETLVSPSGFHPDEKVFIQTQIAIHSDTPTYDGVFDGELHVYPM
tara:strand:+ start:687 stop:1094 length:408 start_codon:yes stop_codon:yes gene_type:complete